MSGSAHPVPIDEDAAMTPRRLSIELPEDAAKIVDARIAAGRNPSESDVIREALEALEAQDVPLAAWEERELAASYDEWKANPTGGIPIEEVNRRLEEERALRCAAM
jgi:antitoxin ParD1/3/4